MNPIQTWSQQQVYNFWCDFRAMYGVSPTFEECAKQMDPKHPVTRWRVRDVVAQLAADGWLVKLGEKATRNWAPSVEARLWERWGEVLLVMRRTAAGGDARAKEIMAYVEGNGHRSRTQPAGAGPTGP